jgi:hypothetical protein
MFPQGTSFLFLSLIFASRMDENYAPKVLFSSPFNKGVF